jgi:glc operon protein GlcG
MIEMTLEMAERAVRATQAKARELHTPITVSVVDESGRLVLSARGDGTGFFTPDTSRAKAAAAAAYRLTTESMARGRAEHGDFWDNLSAVVAGQALPSTGGVPIVRDGRVIGAVGCSGGTSEQDHHCATAGADAVGAKGTTKQT